MNFEFLAPLDVEANGLHVDAWATDLEVVYDLNRLELEYTGSASQPRTMFCAIWP